MLICALTQESLYETIDLDDLHDPEASAGILLEMQDRQRYFEGRMASLAVSGEERQVPYLLVCRVTLLTTNL